MTKQTTIKNLNQNPSIYSLTGPVIIDFPHYQNREDDKGELECGELEEIDGITQIKEIDEVAKANISNYSSKTCVGAYMSQIGDHKLLSKEEEVLLGKTIQEGNACEKDQAIILLMEHNLKLAASIAAEYQNRGLDLEDLISEANVGLRRAAEKFKPEFESKFSTYAYHWIKQSILRSIHTKARMVRLPTHLIEKISKLRKVQESISRSLGREASSQELCSQTGNKPATIEGLLNVQSQTSHIDQSSSQSEDEDNDILKSIADQNQPSPHEEVARKNEWATVNKIINELPNRQKEILTLRFGIGMEKAQTLEEVGKITNISRERVRQIENQAIKKVKESINKLDKKHNVYIKKRV